jgi:hypothetical protein
MGLVMRLVDVAVALLAEVFLLSAYVKLRALMSGTALQHTRALRVSPRQAGIVLALAMCADLVVAAFLAVRPALGTLLAVALTMAYTGYVALLPEGEPCLCFGGRFESRTRRTRVLRNAVLMGLSAFLAFRLIGGTGDEPSSLSGLDTYLFAASVLVLLFGLDLLVSTSSKNTVRSAARDGGHEF